MLRRLTLTLCVTAGFAAGDSDSAKTLFAQKCSVCHGAEAAGTDRGPALAGNRRLRTRAVADIARTIRNGTPGGMPAIDLPEDQLSSVADYVHSLNATAYQIKPDGDAAAGERFFFGAGRCSSCHTAGGKGGSNGPDLSNIGRTLTLPELEQSLTDPGARIAPGYALAVVTLNDGTLLRGFVRSRGSHDVQLQTADGRLHLLTEQQYKKITPEAGPVMPPLRATPEKRRNLVAWLSRLGGITEGSLTTGVAVRPAAFEAILRPKAGDWPTY